MILVVTQEELDAIVTQRLEWAARFASAVSHEVGNIVLFAEASDPDAPHSAEVQAYREQYAYIIQHFRQLLSTLALWKSHDVQRGKLASVTAWWRSQGGFLRQFVPRSVPVTLTSAVAENREVDVAMLTRLLAALLIAIEVQVPKLERIAMEASTQENHAERVCLGIKVSPQLDFNSLAVPAIITKQMGGEAGVSLTHDRSTGTIVLGVNTALQGSKGAGADRHLFPQS